MPDPMGRWIATGAPARFPANIILRDAQLNAFEKGTLFSTDPPYYDNVAYADLSDLLLRLAKTHAY